ncbi:MAG: CAAX prenyl protease-related protein [Armatimonadetes bacterium CG_4_10_14_3_um_filter_66_18]|nr:CAAX prenyl protease-related protein [Armatimonadota bacterium]PIU91255.1 MAG: CAAX prenyl protease-related protein [Armatimonadetes bacterium CG06_land_8_20_14_3_00_66_21]PIX45391.1 MAG: CAAX prenyl protease-related protein [Armatimonadetes bacterium CG_4_8_14_3_um_filter_66_20]PIY49945.1 MAG: CAAX prenyl protease-related protein [Armatimonadetes bacterium CG_4_10_14_3_um_filter_66_18]PIZ35369.1 MAG: CAAX prenyl protease-related protein [Armatimonadetes bacterium CG_4_10_14_0_8_um_filter_66
MPEQRHAARAHLVPFAVWMALLFLLPILEVPSGLGYAVRTAVCLLLLVGLRPWRWYEAFRLRHAWLALAVGVAVCAVWVLPESPWIGGGGGVQRLYLKYCVLPFGKLPEPVLFPPCAPENCGWLLTVTRLVGSAFVIAAIEEFFWRGFLYRWLLRQDFLSVGLGVFGARAFVLTAVLFGFEHNRWLAGILAGLAYGWLAVRTRDLWAAALAHVVTNLLLGVYVLTTGQYGFW